MPDEQKDGRADTRPSGEGSLTSHRDGPGVEAETREERQSRREETRRNKDDGSWGER